jgi:ABC-type tungstate transport system substrate-binding protein
MVLAQLIVAPPNVAGFTYAALSLQDPDPMRADGAVERLVAYELVRAARAPIPVAVAARFGRAIAKVGATLSLAATSWDRPAS